jgi:hypothetical protein
LEEELRLTEESIKSSTNEQEASRLKIKLHESMISRKQVVINELEEQHNSLALELYEINTHNNYVKELSNQKEKRSSSVAPSTPLASAPKKVSTPAPKPTPPQQPIVQKKQAETPKPRATSPVRVNSPQVDAVEQMKKYLSDLEKKRELMKSKLKQIAAPTVPDAPQPSAVATQPEVEQTKANSTPSKKKKKKKKVAQEDVQPIPNLNTDEVFYYLHESPPVFFLESYGAITRYSAASSLFSLLQEQAKPTDSEYHTATNGSQHSNTAQPESSINNSYESPLVAFRSYRLSAAFQELNPRESVVSSSMANKIDPMLQFCLYESHGECKDPDCKLQHRRDYKLDDTQIIKQLLAYAGDDTEVLQLQDECNKELTKKPLEQVAKGLIHRLQKHQVKLNANTQERQQPQNDQSQKRNLSVLDELSFDQNILALSRSQGSGATRFYHMMSAHDYDKIIERDPSDISNWIKLAMQYIVECEEDFEQGVASALATMSSALEKHRMSIDAWVVYLSLYRSKYNTEADAEQLDKLCLMALKMTGTSSLYLWLLYSTIKKELSEKLKLLDTGIEQFSKLKQMKTEGEETDLTKWQTYRSRCVVVLTLEKVRLLCAAGHFGAAVEFLKKALTTGGEDVIAPIDVEEDDNISQSPIFTQEHRCNLWTTLISMVLHDKFPLGHNLLESVDWVDLLPYIDRPIGIDFSRIKDKIETVRKNLTIGVTRDSILQHLDEKDRTTVKQVEEMFKEAFKHFYTAYSRTCLPLCLSYLTFYQLLHDIEDTRKKITEFVNMDQSVFSMWEYYANFEGAVHLQAAKEIYRDSHVHYPAEFSMYYSHAAFILQTRPREEALSLISNLFTESVTELFNTSQQNDDDSVLVEDSDDEQSEMKRIETARFLFRRALNITYDNLDEVTETKLPTDYQKQSTHNEMQEIAKEKVFFLWLNYIFFELLRDTSGKACKNAFNEAIHTFPKGSSEREKIWKDYLEYLLHTEQPSEEAENAVDRCLREEDHYYDIKGLEVIQTLIASGTQPLLKALMKHVLRRDFHFHNTMLVKFFATKSDSLNEELYESAITVSGNQNSYLDLRWAEHMLKTKRVQTCNNILKKLVENKPTLVEAWKR